MSRWWMKADYIETCNISEANCVQDCESESRSWSASGKQAVLECLLDLSCTELGQAQFYESCKDLR